MKRKSLAAALGLAIVLGGCAFVQDVITGSSVAQASPAVVMQAEKDLTIAHMAYDFAGHRLFDLSQPGQPLHGQAATTAQFWYDKAGDALKAADAADNAANAASLPDKVSAAKDAIAAVGAIIKPFN